MRTGSPDGDRRDAAAAAAAVERQNSEDLPAESAAARIRFPSMCVSIYCATGLRL